MKLSPSAILPALMLAPLLAAPASAAPPGGAPVPSAPPVAAPSPFVEPVQTPVEALGEDAGEYARLYAVPIADAYRRLAAQQASLAETDRLQVQFRDRLAGLTGQVLKFVNSSYFGLARSVSRMEQAISYLGINIVRSLVLSHEICESADRVQLPPGFSIERYQAHALLTANIARTIMRQEARALADVDAALDDFGAVRAANVHGRRHQSRGRADRHRRYRHGR